MIKIFIRKGDDKYSIEVRGANNKVLGGREVDGDYIDALETLETWLKCTPEIFEHIK